MSPKEPYKLCTVNKVPTRAKVLIGRLVESQKESYTIDYVSNAERIEDVKTMVEEYKPDVLFVASMWTGEEAEEIFSIAREVKPEIKTLAIPFGLQIEKGPEAVVEFLNCGWPKLIEG
ncbi:hypothetical protein HYALB_00000721 [Hymenoscyphus albidus]|uniref:Uncharacterized protein n=1 Tax=Hymenoscyphus albidus TaxID=595503 RepID=A0A9N9LMK1_9HELO|nr:hypothetical protein HYALB_00000721 [Hymenoscyphus albidus]